MVFRPREVRGQMAFRGRAPRRRVRRRARDGLARAATAAGAGPRRCRRAAASANGFAVAGGKDATFDKVGTALASVDGLVVDSSAKLLGAYDVSYGGEKFLVRVAATDAGAYVSAVDARGVAATGAAASRLIAELKGRLAAN